MSGVQLPPGWEARYEPNMKRNFYVDHNTKTTHWNPPIIMSSAAPPPPAYQQPPPQMQQPQMQQQPAHVTNNTTYINNTETVQQPGYQSGYGATSGKY